MPHAPKNALAQGIPGEVAAQWPRAPAADPAARGDRLPAADHIWQARHGRRHPRQTFGLVFSFRWTGAALAKGRASSVGRPDEALATVRHASGDLPAGNFIDAEIAAHYPEDGLTEARSAAGPLLLRRTSLVIGTCVRVFVPVSDIVVATEQTAGLSALNRLSGHLVAVEDGHGTGVTLTVDCHGQLMVAEVTRRSLRQLELEPGKPVHLLFKTVSIASESLYRKTKG